jgi:hypothetical protein
MKDILTNLPSKLLQQFWKYYYYNFRSVDAAHGAAWRKRIFLMIMNHFFNNPLKCPTLRTGLNNNTLLYKVTISILTGRDTKNVVKLKTALFHLLR